VTADALDTEYENGVADVLAYLAGPAAVVERNVHMPGRNSGVQRQIDVRVTGALFGSGSATMIVDCKRHKRPLDVNDVGAFVALVEDVGADIGLLVSTRGASPAAQQAAANARGIRLDVVSVEELAAWSPQGTYTWEYAVPEALYPEATRALRRAGFRVSWVDVDAWRGDVGVGARAFRHFGTASPDGLVLAEAEDRLLAVLRGVGVSAPVLLGSGVVTSGGTPGHRWLEVLHAGQATGMRVLAANEAEIAEQLDWLAETFPDVRRDEIDVLRPDEWPIPLMFPRW
jgi:hypothetical protein